MHRKNYVTRLNNYGQDKINTRTLGMVTQNNNKTKTQIENK